MQRGITLLELMVAFAMVAIFFTMAIPALHHIIRYSHRLILQSQLLDAIHLARDSAYTRKMPVGLCQSKDGEVCTGEGSDGLLIFVDVKKNDGAIDHVHPVIAYLPLHVNHGTLHFRAYPFYRSYLRFMPAGQWTDNGLFWYCEGSEKKPVFTIAINRLGEAHLVVAGVDVESYNSCVLR